MLFVSRCICHLAVFCIVYYDYCDNKFSVCFVSYCMLSISLVFTSLSNALTWYVLCPHMVSLVYSYDIPCVLSPVIRKMINNFNYNALDIKMEKCKVSPSPCHVISQSHTGYCFLNMVSMIIDYVSYVNVFETEC